MGADEFNFLPVPVSEPAEVEEEFADVETAEKQRLLRRKKAVLGLLVKKKDTWRLRGPRIVVSTGSKRIAMAAEEEGLSERETERDRERECRS